jgi:DNA-binding response OmpR family regulator
MHKLLVVEAESRICDLLSRSFGLWSGTDVHCIIGGQPGARAIEEQRYDLALIDIMLHDLPYLTLAEMAARRHTPVLLLPGHPAATEKLAQDGWDFVSAPFSISSLRARCQAIVAETGDNIARVKASTAKLRASGDALRSTMAESQTLIAEIRQQHGRK